MKRYQCKLCGQLSETQFDHGVHSNAEHRIYLLPKLVLRGKKPVGKMTDKLIK